MLAQEPFVISSSDDEEAVVPLKLIRSDFLTMPEPPDDPNSYEELYKYSMEKCEFCDSIFHCRYDMIIHNAKHIIVPLMNLNTHKCLLCLHVFTSRKELHHHKQVKHDLASAPKVLQSFFSNESMVKKRNDNVPKTLAPALASQASHPIKHKVLDNLVRNKPAVECENVAVTKSNIKSRLVFEDEDDDIICLDNEDTSHMNSYYFNTNVNNLILGIVNNKLQESLSGVKTGEVIQSAPSKLKVLLPTEVNLEKLPPSVHYDQLRKPGLYRCKRCTKTFPNRYEHVIHDTQHMKFKKQIRSRLCTLCDRHIAGNHHVLHHHIETVHPGADGSRNRSVSNCKLCNLKFHNSLRHSMNYHAVHMCECCKRFFTKTILSTHYEECKRRLAFIKNDTENGLHKTDLATEVSEEQPDIMRVCEVCAFFFKNRHNIRYVCIGENSKLECNQTCQRCNKEAYVIKLIKRVKINIKLGGQYKVRALSNNENRLKNIQQRLKFMNTLSRC